MVVAIDGPAGVGKSTVAATVAREMGFLYLNSGDLYRSVTRRVLDRGADPEDREQVLKVARECDFSFSDGHLLVDGRSEEGRLHSDGVDRWVSLQASIPEVRAIVNRVLRAIAADRDIVVEGRDIGTDVFPHAELKVFLDARLEVRAGRRFEQGTSRLSRPEIERHLDSRDSSDRNRPVGSLKKSEDAIYLDTSDLTIREVCDRVVREIHRKRKNREMNTGNERR